MQMIRVPEIALILRVSAVFYSFNPRTYVMASSPIVNVSLQIVPIHTTEPYPIIDAAIARIQQSGLTYQVTAFATLLEGEYEVIMALIAELRTLCFQAGATELLFNMQLHARRDRDVFLEEKTAKFQE